MKNIPFHLKAVKTGTHKAEQVPERELFES
jgi:hypothetical protein